MSQTESTVSPIVPESRARRAAAGSFPSPRTLLDRRLARGSQGPALPLPRYSPPAARHTGVSRCLCVWEAEAGKQANRRAGKRAGEQASGQASRQAGRRAGGQAGGQAGSINIIHMISRAMQVRQAAAAAEAGSGRGRRRKGGRGSSGSGRGRPAVSSSRMIHHYMQDTSSYARYIIICKSPESVCEHTAGSASSITSS